jgi:hypothetical protein
LERVLEPDTIAIPNASLGWGCWLVDPHFGTWEGPGSGDMLSKWNALARSLPRLERCRH